MRNLASIQKIIDISPIEGADRVELATVLGWKCVVNKGQFKPGDLSVYFEIDSFLPIRPEFEFLRKNCYKKNDFLGEGFKIRTQKFRGQISQGLIMPLSTTLAPALARKAEEELKNGTLDYDKISFHNEGDDVTELLGVRKWELPEQVTPAGTIGGKKPEFIKTTDEIRIQSKPELLEEFKGLPYYITTKCDGSSHSIGVNFRDEFVCASRNCLVKESDFVNYVREHGFEDALRSYKAEKGLTSIVVQGEWCGAGIQKNRLGLIKPEWFVFTVDENGERVGLDETIKVCDIIKASMVPIDEVGDDLVSKYPTIEDLLAKSEGTYPNGGTREGIVIRPVEPICSKITGTSLSVKVINNKYLLKNED